MKDTDGLEPIVRIAGVVATHGQRALAASLSTRFETQQIQIFDEKARTVELMNKAIPDALVTGHEDLIGGLKLPDPDDRYASRQPSGATQTWSSPSMSGLSRRSSANLRRRSSAPRRVHRQPL